MKKRWLSGIVAVLFVSQSSAQAFDDALNKWATRFPVEKIYIHYDQEYYVPGETIWFKAYLYGDGKPAGTSTNLYIQFSNSLGQVINSKQYPLIGAAAKGSIVIPDSLPQGDYYIRALTPAMLEQGSGLVYKKRIPVLRSGSTTPAQVQSEISLKFFPESGQLVDGIMSTVAFKATDQWGMPVAIEGTIRSEGGATITPFRSYHDGIGKLQFTPEAGKKYTAAATINGQMKTWALPEVQMTGVNLHVEGEKGGKLFLLSRSEKNKKEFEVVSLVVQLNQHVVYENEIGFEDYLSVKGHLLTDSLPSGILHFTVFNNAGIPLVERLAFVDNGEYKTDADVSAKKTGKGKRGENTIELKFPDEIQRSCSVSVIDGSVIGTGDEENIYSRVLLTSDLKGYVYNPAWYFQKKGDSTKPALDNLMLTHGWSRFNWTKIMGKETLSENNSAPYLSVSGKVIDEKSKEPYTNGVLKIYLESEDSTTNTYDVKIDDKGAFHMDSLLFFGKAKFFYAYTDRNEKQKPAKVQLDNNTQLQKIEMLGFDAWPIELARMHSIPADMISSRIQYAKTRETEIKELERVTLQSKNKKPSDIVNEKYTNGVFRGQSKVTLDNINDPVKDKTMNVVDYIRNRVQQVELQGGGFVNRKNFSIRTGQKWAVGVFLNEIPTDIASLRTTRVTDVALVKFFEAGFVGVGSGSPGGAIAVYTKERFDGEVKPEKLDHVVYNGYSITKEFYHPDYSAKDVKHPSTDHRVTLFWNPDIYLDAGATSIQFEFFNNDAGKKFKVIVEGFDAAGRLIHVEKMIGEE